MKFGTKERFLTGIFCIVAGVSVVGGGMMHAGDLMDMPYSRHNDAFLLHAKLTKPSDGDARVAECEENLVAGKGCDAEAIKLMMTKKDNENALSHIFSHVVPLGLVVTLVGVSVWPSRKKESENSNIPSNPGLTM